MDKKILIVDDEKLIVKGLKFSLEQDDLIVDCAYDGLDAVEKARETLYDIILLDVMLPRLSGFEVCQQIREFSNVPIIMLTAKGDDMDKILGLDYGADDYMTKPFNILEVKARIKAIIRRTTKTQAASGIMEFGRFVINSDYRRVFIDDKEINVTAREYELLEFLVNNAGKVYSREELLAAIWNSKHPEDLRTVDVHVRRLREKIEANPSEPRFVHTKWGVGYYFRV